MALEKANAQAADADDNPLIGPAQAHIADASVAHALADTFNDEESEAALNALGGKINAILLVLEAHGLTKAS